MALTRQPGLARKTSVDCRCEPTVAGERLVLDATDCPGNGRLAAVPACRETAVAALCARDVETVVTRTTETERVYEDDAAALLVAAGRFVSLLRGRDDGLAERALGDPLGTGRAASGRGDPVRLVAVETGLVELALRAGGYESVLEPTVVERDPRV